ncbi:MAG: hypothetical protein M3297_16525, partial [Thermoproteota archaeon]|nr:hypothetical protein [Thermoproteota archaeon]
MSQAVCGQSPPQGSQAYVNTLKEEGNHESHLKQVGNYIASTKYRQISIIFLVIPLVLAAYTHLWNPVGFPRIHPDEGYYIGRSIHVSEGLGAKEEASRYDHPYFGWLFLGSIFNALGYPDSANPKPGDVSAIEMVWLFPRTIVGILAVADTFLIYKIAESRYNRTVAFIAAVLFAVTPLGWLFRRMYL